MKQRVIIDRFEGDFAVCEQHDKIMVNIARALMPMGAQEGDVLVVDGNVIQIDRGQTVANTEYIKDLTENLWS